MPVQKSLETYWMHYVPGSCQRTEKTVEQEDGVDANCSLHFKQPVKETGRWYISGLKATNKNVAL